MVALSGAVGHAFGRFGYGVIYPALRDDLVITNTIAGFIGSANVAAYLVGTLIVAWVTSRLRLLTVMKAGLVMATLGLLLASIASGPSLLAAGCTRGQVLLWDLAEAHEQLTDGRAAGGRLVVDARDQLGDDAEPHVHGRAAEAGGEKRTSGREKKFNY